MDGDFKTYDHVTSSDRIASILDQPAAAREQTTSPSGRDRLTLANGSNRAGSCGARNGL